MVIILFGLPGSGKNYIGEILKNHFGFYFYDADKDLTPAIKKAIRENRRLVSKEFDEYFRIVSARFKRIVRRHRDTVMAQVFIRERDRKLFKKIFPKAQFLYIQTPTLITNQRLIKRRHLVKKLHVKEIRKYYEKPKIKHIRFKNIHNEKRTISELKSLLHRLEKK